MIRKDKQITYAHGLEVRAFREWKDFRAFPRFTSTGLGNKEMILSRGGC